MMMVTRVILDGGPFMLLLVATSVISLAFVVERGWALRWRRVIPPAVEAAVGDCSTVGDLARLGEVCRRHPSMLSRLLMRVIAAPDATREEISEALETRARHEITRLERGLVVLEVVVGIAPLLGLLGTIHGLITLFGGLGDGPLQDSAVLARGISIALYTTMAGLVIAIPSLVAWSYYTRKVETLAVEAESVCGELVQRLHRRGGDGA